MKPLSHTLISDGRTDANLIPIINWTLKEVGGVPLAKGERAEFWRLRQPPLSIEDKIRLAINHYPCEVFFIHRDAEKESPEHRNNEIRLAVEKAAANGCRVPAVTIVPVRMVEAWLLFNERAIRLAAGNPHGKSALNLPPLKKLEDRPDPKEDLRQALKVASELTGRRLKKFNTDQAFWRIVDYLEDFTPLRQLPAYRAFESAVCNASQCNWAPGFYGIQQGFPV